MGHDRCLPDPVGPPHAGLRWLTGPRCGGGLPVKSADPARSRRCCRSSSSRRRPRRWRPSSGTASARLEPLAPRFVSVTYGAGGSTQERTHATVSRIVTETSADAGGAPHLRQQQAGRGGRDRATATGRRACATSWRCAATCPRRRPL